MNVQEHPESNRAADRDARRALLIWVLLITGTGLAWALGETGAGGVTVFGLLFGMALFKGGLVIFDYMAIRHAPLLWRFLMFGWLVVVCVLIAMAYWMGLKS